MILGKQQLILIIAVLLLSACTKDVTTYEDKLDSQLTSYIKQASPNGNIDYYLLPSEYDLSSIPQDIKYNPLTKEKVSLGKMLFFDTGLALDAKYESGKGTYSCATCHVPEAGFRPGNYQGIADGGIGYGTQGEDRTMNSEDYNADELDIQSARPLNLLNVAYVETTFWNGQFGSTGANENTEHLWGVGQHETEVNHKGFAALECQNIEGLEAHRIRIDREILSQLGYIELFNSAFPEIANEDTLYTKTYASFAISAYLRTLLTTKSPFQYWLNGEKHAMSESQKRGAILFFSKAKCSNCHYEPNLGSKEFHALGVKDMHQMGYINAYEDDFRNKGRASFTLNDDDLYKFKVPGIYNMNDTKFYFHGSSKFSLKELLQYKNVAQSENPNVPQEMVSDKFKPLNLTNDELSNLEEFLKIGLRDTDLLRYKPSEVPSGQCFPNADPISLVDMGCN